MTTEFLNKFQRDGYATINLGDNPTTTIDTIVDEAINDLETCLIEAPVDFLGTGSNSIAADKEYKEWNKKWNNALKVIREWRAQQQPLSGKDDDKQEFLQYVLNAKKEFMEKILKYFPHEQNSFAKDAPPYEMWVDMRIAAEDIIIAYDQLKERYKAAAKGYTLKDIEDAYMAGLMYEHERLSSSAPQNKPNLIEYLSSINKK